VTTTAVPPADVPLERASPSLRHLRRMTDETGLIQHAWRHLPDRRHGYTLDDNARALAVAVGMQRLGEDTGDLVDRYLTFVRFAQEPEGRFHNFLGYDRRWLDAVATEDAHGRAVAALGYTAACAPDPDVREAAARLAGPALAQVGALRHARAIAHSLIGVCWLHAVGRRPPSLTVERLAARLVRFYEEHAGDDWTWFESTVTYDNGRLPLALLLAFAATGVRRYADVAGATLEFLVRQVYRPDGMLEIIGNKGWCQRGGSRAEWDQQPVDAASMAEVTAAAAQVLRGGDHYRALALAALQWFDGRNRSGARLRIAATGACHDGLNRDGPNANLGAESTLAVFQAWLALHDPGWTVPEQFTARAPGPR
jgi:hypothetical protein